MVTRTDAYVDTSAFIAVLDSGDTYHPLFRRLFADPPRLLTTSLVVAEGHAWFLRRYDGSRALQFMSFIEALAPLGVLSTGQHDVAAGAILLREYSDQRLTLTDAVGLQTMRDHRVRSCWSTDRHMRLTGVSLVIDQH